MQESEKQPLILTLRLDNHSAAFFDDQRKHYFPPERNLLAAHLTLFHHLPDEPETIENLMELTTASFKLKVTGLINLGAGVAYRIESSELITIRKKIQLQFADQLIPQDKQPFRPHITIMNKSTPEKARTLLSTLSENFQPFTISAIGIDLWTYMGGPWLHKCFFNFME